MSEKSSLVPTIPLKDFDKLLMVRYVECVYVVAFKDRAALLAAVFADRDFREFHMKFCGYNDKDLPLVEIVARFESFRR